MSFPLTLYYRNDCHLCEQMVADIRILYGDGLRLNLVNVDADAVLQAQYGLLVPVLAGGTVILSMGVLDRSILEDYLNDGTNSSLKPV